MSDRCHSPCQLSLSSSFYIFSFITMAWSLPVFTLGSKTMKTAHRGLGFIREVGGSCESSEAGTQGVGSRWRCFAFNWREREVLLTTTGSSTAELGQNCAWRGAACLCRAVPARLRSRGMGAAALWVWGRVLPRGTGNTAAAPCPRGTYCVSTVEKFVWKRQTTPFHPRRA